MLFKKRCQVQQSDYFEVADQIIQFANEISDEWVLPFLSALFMYDPAWYNTFILALLPRSVEICMGMWVIKSVSYATIAVIDCFCSGRLILTPCRPSPWLNDFPVPAATTDPPQPQEGDCGGLGILTRWRRDNLNRRGDSKIYNIMIIAEKQLCTWTI